MTSTGCGIAVIAGLDVLRTRWKEAPSMSRTTLRRSAQWTQLRVEAVFGRVLQIGIADMLFPCCMVLLRGPQKISFRVAMAFALCFCPLSVGYFFGLQGACIGERPFGSYTALTLIHVELEPSAEGKYFSGSGDKNTLMPSSSRSGNVSIEISYQESTYLR